MARKVAVIVGRFQAQYLHSGHQKLIRAALAECDKVIIFVGRSIVRSDRNPLPFNLVKQSLESLHGTFEVLPLPDKKTDELWLENLFKEVREFTNSDDKIIYYGSRDSFLSTLPEDINIVNIASEYNISATNLRANIHYHNDRYFREGYIRAVLDEFPAHYSVVDAIITDGENVLLGRKDSGWCIIGGFADAEDGSLENAILREVKEETNLELKSTPKYFMSHECNDWRYRLARQPFSSVFICEATLDEMNSATASDDINEVKVVPLSEIENYLEEQDSHLMYIRKYLACQS